MTDKPSPPPPPAPWMVALAGAVERMIDDDTMAEDMGLDNEYERILALIQKHALPASSAREERLATALRDLVKVNEEWNASVQAIIGRPPGWNDSYLAEARKALEER